ncbi:hypothetical protein OGB99_002359 [Salmonella enterica]|nr:hypothetical protein [Salmonella enterica]EIR0618377.1 hypothetical protein [Salmonella enterica]EJV8542531.1 hypothetical protein [Salmonella enterica]EJW5364526.1 hypothetical protein [Salmonella enterica]EJY7145607.1 hypothetical protein [Salmonella enterica]
MMKKLKEIAAISLFALLAAGFSASAMAYDQAPERVPAAEVGHGVLSLIQMVWSCRRF